jgi:hypothetical protein
VKHTRSVDISIHVKKLITVLASPSNMVKKTRVILHYSKQTLTR